MLSVRASLILGPLLWAASCTGIPYDEYILAPATRDLIPASVYQVCGSVVGASALTSDSSATNATFSGISSATYDFGRNVAGIVSVGIGSSSSQDAFIGVTFSESSLWINTKASDATADAGLDSPLWFPVGSGPGVYTAERKHNRGGFRYLTLVSNTTAIVSVNSVQVNFTAAPTQDLRAYTGYFHSNDELINKIWYAGAYTNQLCTIDPADGDSLPFLDVITSSDNITLPDTNEWWSNYTITNGSSALTDGAKRDRLVWPGDMSISLESVAVSTYDLDSIRNSLDSLLAMQLDNGRLPYAGRPVGYPVSYPYHLHTLIGMAYYYRYSGDRNWLSRHWDQYKRAVQWVLSSIDDSGLANITAGIGWRFSMGGYSIETNAMLHYVLNDGLKLAATLQDDSVTANWSSIAAGIKSAANVRLWDDETGLYGDNESSTLHPQDGNVLAIKANLTLSDEQTARVSAALRSRWGPFGAPAPEQGETISPFISSFELQAHYLAKKPENALDLMRLQWGFMLQDPRMTQSTFIEGYSTDGTLRYAPYKNDARISHAHGWSTGPTSALTSFAAGLRLIGAGGATWLVAPQPGDLRNVSAGFSTSLGLFATSFVRSKDRVYRQFSFTAPNGTTEEVHLPGVEGTLVGNNGERVELIDGIARGVKGGTWELEIHDDGEQCH